MADIFFQIYLKILLEVFIILLWGWGVLYTLSKIGKYKYMFFGTIGCLGLMLIAGAQTFLQFPSFLIELFPNASKIFVARQEVQGFFYNLSFYYQREALEAFLQICLVAALVGRFKKEESVQRRASVPASRAMDDAGGNTDETISAQEDEPTVATPPMVAASQKKYLPNEKPAAKKPAPTSSDVRMVKEFDTMQTVAASPLDNTTVVPTFRSSETKEEPPAATQKRETASTEPEDHFLLFSEEEEEKVQPIEINLTHGEEESPAGEASEEAADEEEYEPIEINLTHGEEESPAPEEAPDEEEYEPIEINLTHGEEESPAPEEAETNPAEEDLPRLHLDIDGLEEGSENIAEENASEEQEEQYEPLELSNPVEEEDQPLELDVDKIETAKAAREEDQEDKKETVKSAPVEIGFMEDEEEEDNTPLLRSMKKIKSSKPSSKNSSDENKKLRKKSKKVEEEEKAQSEGTDDGERPLLGTILPAEDLPKKIRKFKLE